MSDNQVPKDQKPGVPVVLEGTLIVNEGTLTHTLDSTPVDMPVVSPSPVPIAPIFASVGEQVLQERLKSLEMLHQQEQISLATALEIFKAEVYRRLDILDRGVKSVQDATSPKHYHEDGRERVPLDDLRDMSFD